VELLTVLFLWLPLAPPVEPDVRLDDLRMFPSRPDVIRITKAAWDNHVEMRSRPPLFLSEHDRDAWFVWDRDAYTRWYVWDDVLIAQNATHTEEYRLTILRRLRQWVGHEAYYNGALPPPVPAWRIQFP
jgi:hypothetical protein